MSKRMLKLEVTKPSFIDNDHRFPGKPFEVDSSVFPKGKDSLPAHIKLISTRVISDDEIKADEEAAAAADAALKAELVQKAKDLQIKGVHAGWGLEKLKEAIDKAMAEIETNGGAGTAGTGTGTE